MLMHKNPKNSEVPFAKPRFFKKTRPIEINDLRGIYLELQGFFRSSPASRSLI